MGKLGSFATGVGAGYLASERYKDSKKRQDRQDSVLEKFLGVDDGYKPLNADVTETVPLNQLTDEQVEEMKKRPGYSAGMANGGMVAPMPQHWDKMEWQRQSFKK